MKKQIIKTIAITIIWILLLTCMIINRSFATEELKAQMITDKTSYQNGNDIYLKVKLNTNILTASFYINYDSSKITFKRADTASTATNAFPSDGVVRVVYADISGNGTNEIVLVFTINSETSPNPFTITNTTMTVAESDTTFSQSNISGINTPQSVTVVSNTSNNNNNNNNNNTQNSSNSGNNSSNSSSSSSSSSGTNKTNLDPTTSKTTLPQTGENDTFIVLFILTVLVTVYLGYNFIKIERYFKF